MNHIRPTVVIIISFVLLLTSGVMATGASAQTKTLDINQVTTDQIAQSVSSETPGKSMSDLRNANSTNVLAPQANWIPPLPAYKVMIAPDAGHKNRELIFGDLDGIYQLSYTYLQTAGLPVDTLDPRTFRMFYMGVEIPIVVEGGADGSFDAGVGGAPDDAMVFYGRGIDSLFDDGLLPTNKYTDANIYWLTYGGVNGLPMALKDGSITGGDVEAYLHTERIETNLWYWSVLPFLHDADHWYWQSMQATDNLPTPLTRTDPPAATKIIEIDFTINHLAPGAHTGFLTATFVGETDGRHHIRTYINDNLVVDDSTSWADADPFEATGSVPQSYFVEGNNTIKVELVVDANVKISDKVYLNWVKVGYYDQLVAEGDVLAFGNDQAGNAHYSVSDFSSDDIEVYDVSDFMNVKQIDNVAISAAGSPYSVDFGDTVTGTSRYLALTRDSRLTPADIQAVSLPTLLMSPTNLLDTSNEADYIVITHADFWDEAYRLANYRDREYRVALIDVQQIYDQFNGGLVSAEAIRDFLEFAHASWTQPAPMFVALMGDGTSDMRNYRYTPINYVPPYLSLVDPDLGETASQNQFVTLTGGDVLPDMHIGRLPVNSLAEAQAMVDKIIDYEVLCQCDSWNYETLFVADDLEGGGGNFFDFSDRVADGYHVLGDPTSKYVPEPPYNVHKIYLGQTCDLSNPSQSVECRAEFIDSLNTDGALFVSWVGHSTKDYWGAEKIVDIDSINQLDNAPCLPLAVSMTCFEGSFQDPVTTSLAEHAVRIAEDGFIASWSPTGFGLATGHDLMEEGLMLAMLHDDVFEIGAAITQAKVHLSANSAPGQYDDLINTFILLGDPALKPKTDAVCSNIPTAIQMENYGIQAQPDALHVTWRTTAETDILGFNVLRRSVTLDGDGAPQPFEQVNAQIMLAHWSGMGVGDDYAYVDSSVTSGITYGYKLEVVNVDGTIAYFDLGDAFTFSPVEFEISTPISR